MHTHLQDEDAKQTEWLVFHSYEEPHDAFHACCRRCAAIEECTENIDRIHHAGFIRRAQTKKWHRRRHQSTRHPSKVAGSQVEHPVQISVRSLPASCLPIGAVPWTLQCGGNACGMNRRNSREQNSGLRKQHRPCPFQWRGAPTMHRLQMRYHATEPKAPALSSYTTAGSKCSQEKGQHDPLHLSAGSRFALAKGTVALDNVIRQSPFQPWFILPSLDPRLRPIRCIHNHEIVSCF